MMNVGGRGNIDHDAIQKTKQLFRLTHPKPLRLVDIAKHTGKSVSAAKGIIDYLSGTSQEIETNNTEFLVYANDDKKTDTYSIFKDSEKGICAL